MLARSGRSTTLVGVEVTCIDRFASSQDGVVLRLSRAALDGIRFADVDLTTLYQRLDFTGCD